MEKKEFIEMQERINNELRDLYRQQDKKRYELDKLRDDWCHELCNQYQQYKGKRVKIVFERKMERHGNSEHVERKEVEGFLVGFSYRHRYGSDIMPVVAKIKKDGTPSKNFFSYWEMYSWNEIVSVTEV